MVDGKRCEKYPSLLKVECSHCHGTEWGTDQSPKFSINESVYRGSAVIEILKNDGPVHSRDTNFQFGVRKAQMFLTCLDVLQEFGFATDVKRSTFQSRFVEDRLFGHIWVQMHEEFELSNGMRVSRPFLSFETFPPDNDLKIGIGVQKCRAICAVEDDLKLWIKKRAT
jgi:hypothetical protein